jgi:hypothetical protein
VTITTHCSIENLHRIIDMAAASDMVISAAVLVRKSIGESVALIERLRTCFPDVERLVDFTLVITDPTHEYDDYIDKITGNARKFSDIVKKAKSGFQEVSCLQIAERVSLSRVLENRDSFKYPTVLMQRIARRGVSTEHALLLEIDMRPSVALCAFAKQELTASDVAALQQHGIGHSLRAFVVPGVNGATVGISWSLSQGIPLRQTTPFHRRSAILITFSRRIRLTFVVGTH